ncbi:hypothetical protein BH09VER1_BH09VER1_56120 [soil metagenome]
MENFWIYPRKTNDGFSLLGDRLPPRGLWYRSLSHAIDYAGSGFSSKLIAIHDYDGNNLQLRIVFGDDAETGTRPLGCSREMVEAPQSSVREIRVNWE